MGVNLSAAWEHFRRGHARWIPWYDRPTLFLGGLRLIYRGLRRRNQYLVNMGARACGCACHRRARGNR